MSNKNIIELLGNDWLHITTHFFDLKSIASVSRVCKTWHGLFTHSNIWKNKIKSDFAIDQKILSKLPIPDDKENPLFYKQLYARLYRLKRVINNLDDLPDFFNHIFHDKSQQYLLLMACVDNADEAFNNTPCEEQYILTMMSTYAGCTNIPIRFLKNNWQTKYFMWLQECAARSGNLHLMQYLLDSKNGFDLKPDDQTLLYCAEAGNLQLVQYLLNLKNGFNLKVDSDILHCAAQSGNLQLIKYLLDPKNRFNLKPEQDMLRGAAKSGNLELVKYLLKPENLFNFTPDQWTLKWAIFSGNLKLVRYLLKFGLKLDQFTPDYLVHSSNFRLVKYLVKPGNRYNLHSDQNYLYLSARSGNIRLMRYLLNPDNLRPDQNTLDFSASSGDLRLVKYLLSPDNRFDLKPNQCTLNHAAESGSLRLLKYLLNPGNQFNLIPDQETLKCSAKSGNIRMVKYLLNPKNGFNLKLNQNLIEEAARFRIFGLSEHIFPCHMKMQQALQKLKEADFRFAAKLLRKSYLTCPSHCTAIVRHVLNNPSELNLSQNAIQYLSSAFKKVKIRIANQNKMIETENKELPIRFLPSR